MKTKNYKGITLIALIITIIVLLILAGVSISLVVGDNGVLGQAVNATVATDVAETKEAIELAVIGYLDSNGDYTIKDVEKAVADAGATLGSDGVTVTTAKGNTVDISDLVAGAKLIWEYTTNDDGELAVTNGTTVVTVGDYIDYSAGSSGSYTSKGSATGEGEGWDQTFNASSYTGTWQVLGADEDTGELLILSDVIYSDDTWNDGWYYLCGQEGYLNCESELNKICAIYGNGYGATGARSINADDVNKITGFDPETSTDTSATGKGEVYEYGATVDIYWCGDEYPYFSASNNKKGYLTGYHNNTGTQYGSGFTFFNTTTNSWDKSEYTTDATDTDGGRVYITTITNNGYGYYGGSYITDDTLLYMLFADGNGDTAYYWLASSFGNCYTDYAYWGCRYVYDGYVYAWNLVNSNGYANYSGNGVRSVVSLESDISLEPVDDTHWSIE